MSSVPDSRRLTRSVSRLRNHAGQHPHQRLTAVSVRAKPPPGRYADGNGLYLVVDPVRREALDLARRHSGQALRSRPRWRVDSSRSAKRASKAVALSARRRATAAIPRSNARAATPRRPDVQGRRDPGPRRTSARPSGTRSTPRSGCSRSRTMCFRSIGAAAGRHDRLRRRLEGADADLDGEAGNGAPAETAHEARVRLGESLGVLYAATIRPRA